MPGTLTLAAALSIAQLCATHSDPGTILSIAYAESGLRTDARNVNRNGSVDIGLGQINDSNFQWLGITAKTALDPCVSLRAAERVLIEGYHPTANTPEAQQAALRRAIAAYNCPRCGDNKSYVMKVEAAARKIIPALRVVGVADAAPSVTTPPSPQSGIRPLQPGEPPLWDKWAHSEWLERQHQETAR